MPITTSRRGESLIADNFLSHWDEVRSYADAARYADVINPVDGVLYPGICAEVPTGTKAEIQNGLAEIHGEYVDLRTVFFRLSLRGVQAPHQAHTDSTMGQWSCMVYMNRATHCEGGTSLVTHRWHGMESDVGLDEAGLKVWQRDTNKPEAWSIREMAWMQPNRAFIFASHLMHRAEPVSGFGTNPKNGRLVLTAFYNVGDKRESSIRNRR